MEAPGGTYGVFHVLNQKSVDLSIVCAPRESASLVRSGIEGTGFLKRHPNLREEHLYRHFPPTMMVALSVDPVWCIFESRGLWSTTEH